MAIDHLIYLFLHIDEFYNEFDVNQIHHTYFLEFERDREIISLSRNESFSIIFIFMNHDPIFSQLNFQFPNLIQ
jgi:hypothetical protein